MLEAPAWAKKARRLGCRVDAAAKVVVAPADEPDWHLAFELYPLHRAPGATKIRASVETGLGLFLNDVVPEDAARRLAALAVPAEPIELDTLFTPAEPGVATLP